MKPEFQSSAVAEKFAAYPSNIRRKLIVLRQLIFDTAARTDGVGEITETLKWGEPAYLAAKSKIGTTVRIDWKPEEPTQYAMYFHCQTGLVETFRSLFPTELNYSGNRAIVFDEGQEIPKDAIAFCIAAALTYHRRKNPIGLLRKTAMGPNNSFKPNPLRGSA